LCLSKRLAMPHITTYIYSVIDMRLLPNLVMVIVSITDIT
jgi:hypothetical protein